MKKLIFAAFSLLNACVIFAQATVTKPSLSFTACSYPSNYVSLGDIRIDETNISDIASGNNQTIIITAPVNFEFQSGIGTVQIAPGGDLKSNGLAINVTSSTVTITFDCTGTTKSDIIQISGLRIRVLAAASNTFVRTGGSASINGFGIGTIATNTISSQTLPANTFRSVTNLTGDLAWNSSTTWECGSVPPLFLGS